ncbi:MAG: T9SS type A sorting domain-containing protein [Lutibacter sp.]|nr:T9SS type A sorting domain-containing protein [Lutibacter sp.]MBP9601155.1 T9SS type A sorting domain-containing protein [Lutibacter sp.]
MKKNYLFLAFLCLSFLGFSQAAEFKLDFEGTAPLNNLPAGVSHVDGVGNVLVIVNHGSGNVDETITQAPNAIITDVENSENKVLSMDYLGHLIFTETAIGTGSFTIAGKYDGYMNGGNGQWNGFISLTGSEDGGATYTNTKLMHQFANGQMNGFGITTSSSNGFPLLTTGTSNHFVLTYNATDQLYRFYKDGAIVGTSGSAQTSGSWTNKLIYLGYKGDGQSATTGAFTSPALDGSSRNKDVQKRVDDITVFKRAISDAEAMTLATTGTLAVNKFTQETFSAYPNPVADRLFFTTKDILSVDIYTALGSKVNSQKVTNGVDMSELSKGLYILKCKNINGEEIATIKALKK